MTRFRSFGTHDGSFHADEVTACALLLLFDLIDEDKILRTRSKDLLEQCEYICDVGGIYNPEKKCFDHHQADYQGELSSAGMILLYLQERGILTKKEWQMFNDSLIRGVDLHDNGKDKSIKGQCTYSHIITNYRPIVYDSPSQEEDVAFKEAVKFALQHLKRMWKRYNYVQSCKNVVQKEMEKRQNVLIFEEGIPWMEVFFELGGENHLAKFVIMPSGGLWNLRAIPPTYQDRMSVRIPLPLKWAGLLEEDLKKVSGIQGAVFCHKARFISVWESQKDAIKALDKTLQIYEESKERDK